MVKGGILRFNLPRFVGFKATCMYNQNFSSKASLVYTRCFTVPLAFVERYWQGNFAVDKGKGNTWLAEIALQLRKCSLSF